MFCPTYPIGGRCIADLVLNAAGTPSVEHVINIGNLYYLRPTNVEIVPRSAAADVEDRIRSFSRILFFIEIPSKIWHKTPRTTYRTARGKLLSRAAPCWFSGQSLSSSQSTVSLTPAAAAARAPSSPRRSRYANCSASSASISLNDE